jgi:thiosulfate reductase/polysulfide reductase chain A
MPASEPKYNSKPADWMARELGIRLGLEAFFPWNNIEEHLDWQLKQVGASLEEMKRIGVKKFPRKYDDLYLHEGEDFFFNTNTGKIELYSTDMVDEGFPPFPVYTEHEQPPEGFYRLNYGRAPMHSFGRTANNPNLTDLMDENTLWVNPKVANLWGLKTDQYVKLRNQDGVVSTFSIRVRITERIRWDSVYMVHGFGQDNKKLSRAHGRGINDTELITNVKIDPVMGGTGMRSNFVTFVFENETVEKEAEA